MVTNKLKSPSVERVGVGAPPATVNLISLSVERYIPVMLGYHEGTLYAVLQRNAMGVPNKSVSFYWKLHGELVWNLFTSAFTNDMGVATINFRLPAPMYVDFRSIFLGDEMYKASENEIINKRLEANVPIAYKTVGLKSPAVERIGVGFPPTTLKLKSPAGVST